ncbi:hypothetical protein [Streptomyces chryseus]
MTTTPAVREPGPGFRVSRPPIRGALPPRGPEEGRHRTGRRIAAAFAADGGKAYTR